MNPAFAKAGICLLFLLAAYGWGMLCRGIMDRRLLVFHSLRIVVGLAALNLVGGLLNLLHLAYPAVLLSLLAIGLAAGASGFIRARAWSRRSFPMESLPLFAALALGACASVLVVPGGVFNTCDDFQNYAARVVRMLQTGTLAGNAFDQLGLDSFGSQSYFQGFFVVWGMDLANGFDWGSCYALCLLLLAELSLRWRLPCWLGLSTLLAFTWLNPQCVNLSSVYSGAAGLIALGLCGVILARAMVGTRPTSFAKMLLPMGLITAWLVTLKVTNAFYAVVFLIVLFLGLYFVAVQRRRLITTFLWVSLIAGIAAFPWFLLPMPAVLEARRAGAAFEASAELAGKFPSVACHEVGALFLPIKLLYGNTPWLYFGLAGGALAVGLGGAGYWFRLRDRKCAPMTVATATGVAMMATLLLTCDLFPVATGIRYSCPLLIGGVSLLPLVFCRFRAAFGTVPRLGLSVFFSAVLVCLITCSQGTLARRLEVALLSRTFIAYPFDRTYADYCAEALSSREAAYIKQLQDYVPKNAGMFAWIASPFHLDFGRNRMINVSGGGIMNPVVRFPAGLNPDDFESYLRSNGVRYVLLETKGYGVTEKSDLLVYTRYRQAFYRKLGEYGIYLRDTLEALATRGTVLYSDDRMILFELRCKRDDTIHPQTLLLHKQGQRSGVTVQETLFSDRPDFSVAKEAGEADGTKFGLDVAGIMIVHPEEALATTVATAEAPPVDLFVFERAMGAFEQGNNVFSASSGIAPLKLDSLAHPRECAHRQHASLWVRPDQVADQKVPSVEFIQVLVHHESDKQIAA